MCLVLLVVLDAQESAGEKSMGKEVADAVLDTFVECYFGCMQVYRIGSESSEGDKICKKACLKHLKKVAMEATKEVTK